MWHFAWCCFYQSTESKGAGMLVPINGAFHLTLLFVVRSFFMIPLAIPNIILCVAATMLRLPASKSKTSILKDKKVGLR